MPRAVTRVGAIIALLASAALLTACTTQPMPTPTPTPSATPLGDGILRIGTLFPSTGATAFLGASQLDAVKVAVADINAAGGVNGKPVELVSDDSGDASTQTAEASLADLAKKGVDVVIGPSSSVLSQRLLTAAQAARIPLVSPAATYPQLSTLDIEGIFFRTIASSAHQGVALGTLLPSRKQLKVAVIASSDAVGQSIVAPLGDTLSQHGGSLVANIALTASSDAGQLAAQVKAAAPDAVVLDTLDNGAQTKAVITQLSAAGFGGAKLWLTAQNLADYSQALPAGALTGVNGILEGADASAAFQARLKAVDPGVSSFQYAPEAYDATILVALAATLAHDDNGIGVAAHLRSASVGGIKCTSYAECLDVLESEPAIDYDGISGSVNLDAAGDPSSGSYGVYAYTADNKCARTATVTG
ncbi:ABC transporter substrate-binding protein [Lysinimonas soli]|uniref:ABC transporter substrate-binding protein n=1 Tax=Lysinimonas soli TaxID=1074233 RepID=A0ABW0NST3_9MICO